MAIGDVTEEFGIYTEEIESAPTIGMLFVTNGAMYRVNDDGTWTPIADLLRLPPDS